MILEVKDLSFSYDNTRIIFEKVNFGVDKGEIFTILGRNGAGKSTLLNCVANLFVPKSGGIYLNGQPMNKMKLTQIAQVIGYVPQVHNPAYSYTVRDFTVMGRTPYIGALSKPSKADYDKVDEVLEELGIMKLRDKSYTAISGGERQQVTIARVMVQEPQLILLDEPTAHLDYGNQLRTVKMIKKLADRGFGVIMTTHNPDHAMLLGDKVAILDKQGHLNVDKAEHSLTEEALSELYDIDLKMVYVEEAHRKVCVPVRF